MTTGKHLRTGRSSKFLTLLLVADILESANPTSRIDFYHHISAVATLLHLGVSFELFARLASMEGKRVTAFALFRLAIYTVETIFSVMFGHGRSQWNIVSILYGLQFPLNQLELSLTFYAGDDIALFAHTLILKLAQTLLTDQFGNSPRVDEDTAALGQTLEVTILGNKLFVDILHYARLAK